MLFSFLFESPAIKKRKKLEKLRRRFPWLWAIRQSWSPNYGSVLKKKVGEVDLIFPHQDGERELWLIVREDGYERAIKTVQIPESSIAKTVMEVLPRRPHYTKIEYLAVVEGENRQITILHGTEQRPLDQMCRSLGH